MEITRGRRLHVGGGGDGARLAVDVPLGEAVEVGDRAAHLVRVRVRVRVSPDPNPTLTLTLNLNLNQVEVGDRAAHRLPLRLARRVPEGW